MLVFLCGVPLFSLYGTKWMCEVGFIPFEIGSIRGFLRSVVIAVLAVSSAVCVFSYLHGKSSASASFSLPFSRKTIFRSHALAGWILSVTPVITAGILFAVTFLIKIKSGRLILYANNPPDVRLSYFEVLMMMLIWTFALLIIVTFTYCACVLAGSNQRNSLYAYSAGAAFQRYRTGCSVLCKSVYDSVSERTA